MSGKGKSKLNQSSKSTSSKKMRRKRDISPVRPYSEFPAATSTFSGLVGKLMKYGTTCAFFLAMFGVSNTYASSISISLTGNVNLNILKDNTNPTFGKSTTQTATVTSDHFTGYTLTIAGSNDTGRLVGSNDNTKYLSSITTPLTESQFNTDAHNDQWGFLPSSLYNASTSTTITNTDYQPSPIHTTPTTMDVTNSPTDNDGNDYTLALASRISPNMSLDSYGQTFVLAATGNGYDYHIGYTDTMTTIPADQYETGASSNTVQISSIVPRKDGYVFTGWCTQVTTNTSTGTTCPSGTDTYQPGDTITLDGDSANNIQLYAIWAKGYDTFADAFAAIHASQTSGYYRMQDMTSEICDSIVIGSPYTTADIAKNTLIDTRNNKTYLVAKYADGHCWMRENLNLTMTAGVGVEAYDFATGNPFTYTPEQYGTTQTTAGIPWALDASDGARSYGGDKDKYIGGMNITEAGTVKDTGDPYERIGILYNWAAATAQTGEQARNAGSSGGAEVKTSICPKGWKLPSNGGDYSFGTLMGSYSLPTTNQTQGYSGQLQNPLNFNRLGLYEYSDGTLLHRGTGGWFWTSWGYSYDGATPFRFNSTAFVPHSAYSKGDGFSVRCVAV